MRTVPTLVIMGLLALAIRVVAWHYLQPVHLNMERSENHDGFGKKVFPSQKDINEYQKEVIDKKTVSNTAQFNIADANLYSYRSPGYVWIQRTIEAWVGPDRLSAFLILFNVLVGSLIPCFIWLLCRRLSLPTWLSFGTGLSMSMSPPLVWASIAPSNLGLTILLFNVGLFLVLVTIQTGNPAWGITAGIMLGLACLVESFSFFPVLFLTAGGILLLRNSEAGWLSATFILGGLLATLTPWQLHVFRHHPGSPPISGKDYALFWNGTITDPKNRGIQESLIRHASPDTVSFLQNQSTSDLERASWFSHDGLKRVWSNPGIWAATRLGSVSENVAGEPGFWSAPGGPPPISSGILAFYLFATFFMALFGLTKLAFLPKEAALIWLGFLGWTVAAFLFPFDAHLTWRSLFEPFILVLASIGLGAKPTQPA